MHRAFAIAFASALVMSAVSAIAGDAGIVPASTLALASDEAPPAPASAVESDEDDARAGMCDAFDGLAFTFCVALCEARECDTLAADDERCTLIERGFARASGGVAAPCVEAATAL